MPQHNAAYTDVYGITSFVINDLSAVVIVGESRMFYAVEIGIFLYKSVFKRREFVCYVTVVASETVAVGRT